jgi:TolB protein
MPSLDEHFRALSKVRPPQSWPELGAAPRGLPARPPSGPVRRLAVAVLALAVAAGGLVFAVRAFRTERPSPRPGSTAQNGQIAFSREGREPGLYVMNPDGTGVRPLSDAVDTGAAWSPDGSRIAFVGGFDEEDISIYVMRADGTDVRRVTDGGSLVDGEDLGPSWSPDGMRIAFARGGDIFTVNADGTGLVRLTEGPVVEYEPAWSPDGSRIAFEGYDLASGGEPPSSVRLYVMNSDGTNITELGPRNVQGPAWSPDGTEIAYVDTRTGSIMAIRPDGTEPRQILDAAALVGGVHLVYDVAWSPDGTKLAFMAGPDSEDTHIYVVNRDGSDVRRLTNDRAPDYSPAWQPMSPTLRR